MRTPGQVIWKKKVDPHAFARVTGAPTLHNGRLYVPVSSIEEVPAAQPKYECCTFRGSVVSLDASTGDQIWKSYTIKEQPQQIGKNSVGTPLWGPAGASVWSSPTIDEKRGALYIGTGNSYTGPAVPTSDSVMAMDLKTGKILWWNQATSADAYLVGCRPGNENCPKELGPDFDFGNSPILRDAVRRQAHPRHRPEVRHRLGHGSRSRRRNGAGSTRRARAERWAASSGDPRPTTRRPTSRCLTCSPLPTKPADCSR